MAKVLQIKFENGDVFHVPAEVVAESMADHYATRSDDPEDDKWDEEYAAALGDEDNLVDWAMNNTNWSDLKDHAKLQPREHVVFDHAEHFGNTDMNIITT